jgi:hypothetical protein
MYPQVVWDITGSSLPSCRSWSPGRYRELPEVAHPVHVARARAFAGPLDDVLEV